MSIVSVFNKNEIMSIRGCLGNRDWKPNAPVRLNGQVTDAIAIPGDLLKKIIAHNQTLYGQGDSAGDIS